jgi:hypothetical protein
MIRAFVVILVMVLGDSIESASAQPMACAPQYPEDLPGWRVFAKFYTDGQAQRQAEEARRIGDGPDVFRYLDRLYLVIDDGYKLVTFSDCPVNKDAYFYLYERYDEVGRFYVISKVVHEDRLHYLLVSKKDGSSIEVFGLPVWSPDKSRFVAGHCAASPGEMSIVGFAQDELRTEATFELPCDAGHCEFRWEESSTVVAMCGAGARKLRVAGKGTSWSVVPGSDRGAQMPRP